MKQRNPNDALFLLIKSMSQGEKRFFSLVCSHRRSQDEKNYLKLFHAISRQETYNEELLFTDFSKNRNRLMIAKKYLYKIILNALVQHSREKNKNRYDHYCELDVLFEKGLFELYEILLNKLKTEADESNDFTAMIELLKNEKNLLTSGHKSLNFGKLTTIYKSERRYIDLYKELGDYQQMAYEIISNQNKNIEFNSKSFKQIADRPLFKDLTKPHSLFSETILRRLRGAYFRTTGDHLQAYREHFQEVRIIESNRKFMNKRPEIALGAYMNFAISCHNLKKYEKGLETILKYKDLVFQNPLSVENKLINIYIEELIIYKDTSQKQEAIQLITEVKEKIDTGKIAEEEQMIILFYLNAAFAFLNFGEPRLSLKWVNEVLNYPGAETIRFLYYYNARILQLFNIVDLGDAEFFTHQLKSYRRLILKRGALVSVDKILLDFFMEIHKGGYLENRISISPLVRGLKTNLEKAFKKGTTNKFAFSRDDFSHWLEVHSK